MYRYFVLNLLLKLRLCRYLFKMAAVNPCDFAVGRQTFFERTRYQFSWKHYQKSWKHLPEKLVATTIWGSMPI